MKFQNFLYCLFVLGGLMFLSSCQDDDTGGTDDSPSVTVSSSSVTVDAGDSFTVTVTGSKGSADLRTLTVAADGASVDASHITVSELSGSANPLLLSDGAKSNFSYTYTIVVQSAETMSYTFTLEDEDGLTDVATVSTTVNADPPSIEFNGMSPVTVTPNGAFILNFDFVKGTADLSALAIFENGEFMDSSRIEKYESPGATYDPLESNYFFIEDDASGADGVRISLRASTTPGEYTLTFRLEDTSGLTDEVDVTVIAGNQVTTIEGVLLNSEGPTGTGGLDLDDGVGTGSADSSAEIKDQGIDDTIDPAVEENWLKKISGVNGTELMYIRAGENGVSEDFTFEGVQYRELIESLWDANNTFSESEVINAGDVILANKGGKFYLLNIREVNEVFASNADNYVIDIKF